MDSCMAVNAKVIDAVSKRVHDPRQIDSERTLVERRELKVGQQTHQLFIAGGFLELAICSGGVELGQASSQGQQNIQQLD